MTTDFPSFHKNLISALILVILIPFCIGAQHKLPISRIDSVFNDVNQTGSPGCALLIIQNDEVVYSRGYGYANLDYEIPIDSGTVMYLGSVTKQFVAAAILKASLQGYLTLDDDIRKWIPEFPEYSNVISVSHLIYHTSGIRDELQLRAVANLPEDITRKEIIELLVRQKKLNFEPGEQELYSNGGYLLLIEILERATGMTMQAYLRQEFFKPLGMNSAGFGPYQGAIPQSSYGFVSVKDNFIRKAHVGNAPGVRMNISDLGRWMVALEGDNLSSKGFKDLQLQRGILNNGDTTDYAFGLNVMKQGGLPLISHGGAGMGYRTAMGIYPENNLAICTICNLSNLDAVQLNRRVSEILLEDELGPDEDAASYEKYRKPWPAPDGEPLKLSKEELTEFSGNYYAPELNVIFKVETEADFLKVGPEGWMRPMLATSKSDQFNSSRAWAQINFIRNEKGVITGFTMNIGRVNGLIMERISHSDYSNIAKYK
ncbi:beta-lactamase family protein [Lutimonas saemankumensis]|uniref:serine hydrolase domain-containing protein n=1 Tax=Lutimonas saemankumensis TaxID=483016 RepID=UPI001CD50E4B|nr:serine hydrolase domain-containing protein [Lutimonas saemankumensis]MCA0931739.1 beta-lactamase family protein [Lutimonas saemankumensis]